MSFCETCKLFRIIRTGILNFQKSNTGGPVTYVSILSICRNTICIFFSNEGNCQELILLHYNSFQNNAYFIVR
jgi:hypothetical protein